MDSYILLIIFAIVVIFVMTCNNREHATFTKISPAPNYPLSYIHGVRIGRKVFDPDYHDPAIYRTPNEHLGPN